MPIAGAVTAETYTICLSQLEHQFATDTPNARTIEMKTVRNSNCVIS